MNSLDYSYIVGYDDKIKEVRGGMNMEVTTEEIVELLEVMNEYYIKVYEGSDLRYDAIESVVQAEMCSEILKIISSRKEYDFWKKYYMDLLEEYEMEE